MVIGFVGAGVMARALARGLVDHRRFPASDLICSAPNQEDGKPFVDLFPGSRWTADNSKVMQASDVTVLAIKPQVFADALKPLKAVSAGKLVLSIAAGKTISMIREWLDDSARVVRAMPNTPAQIGLGATAYAGDPHVLPADYEAVHGILSAAGKAWRVEENQLDAVTALSGSGPAYVFHFLEALARGGIALGLSEKLSHELALQTVLGSAHLAQQSGLAPLQLAAQVKSPRGTTLAGCAVLEENDALNSLVARCMAAARNRAEALARGED
jgi:pyrroline-5-carboxylate reductase